MSEVWHHEYTTPRWRYDVRSGTLTTKQQPNKQGPPNRLHRQANIGRVLQIQARYKLPDIQSGIINHNSLYRYTHNNTVTSTTKKPMSDDQSGTTKNNNMCLGTHTKTTLHVYTINSHQKPIRWKDETQLKSHTTGINLHHTVYPLITVRPQAENEIR